MDGAEQLARSLSFLDSGATEEEDTKIFWQISRDSIKGNFS
jgi:hypothetical protein